MKLAARWVVDASGGAIADGVVEMDAGRIVAVRRRSPDEPVDINHGHAVILPGLVNAHTHLELSHLAGQVPPDRDFISWLLKLVDHFVNGGFEDRIADAASQGVRECLRHGVTTIGDITRRPDLTRPVFARSPIRSVSFGEVIAIGRRRGLLQARITAAVSDQFASGRQRIGISPHAPYTMEPAGLKVCAAVAGELRLPMCIHLAETVEEAEFTRRAAGPFRDYLGRIGVWSDDIPAGGEAPIALARSCRLLDRPALLAHVNYVTDDEIALLAATGASVAFCPRTHAAFGHPPHRFRDMLEAGVNVAVGTDSLASNPTLSVLDELRFMHRKFNVGPITLLSLGTINGARALQLGDDAGRLIPGAPADVVVVPLPATASAWHAVFDVDSPPSVTYAAGAPYVEGSPAADVSC